MFRFCLLSALRQRSGVRLVFFVFICFFFFSGVEECKLFIFPFYLKFSLFLSALFLLFRFNYEINYSWACRYWVLSFPLF